MCDRINSKFHKITFGNLKSHLKIKAQQKWAWPLVYQF